MKFIIFSSMKMNKYIKYYLLLLLVINAIIFSGTHNFNFVNWDDDENIRANTQITAIDYENVQYHFQTERYKALALYSFMIDYALWGLDSGPYHLHNVLLHLINILLVFVVVSKLSKNTRIGLISAVFFSLHPVVVESVAWVTARKDLLFLMFSLLSILGYLKYLQDEKRKYLWILLVAVLVYFASMAKIQAFVLPLVFLALDWYKNEKINFEKLLEKLSFFVLLNDYFIIAFGIFAISQIIKYVFVNDNKLGVWFKKTRGLIHYLYFTAIISPLSFTHLSLNEVLEIWAVGVFGIFMLNRYKLFPKNIRIESDRLRMFFSVFSILFLFVVITIYADSQMDTWSLYFLGFLVDDTGIEFSSRLLLGGFAFLLYFMRLFLFKGYNPMEKYPDNDLLWNFGNEYFISTLISFVILGFIVFLIFRMYKKNKLIVLGILIFLINISIVMHVIPISGKIVAADRYVYPAFWGLFIIPAFYIDKYFKNKRVLLLVFTLFPAIIFAFNTYKLIPVWQNSETLWQSAIESDPENHYAYYSLSLGCFVDSHNPKAALEAINTALDIKEAPAYYSNRGRTYLALGNNYAAMDDFTLAIKLDSASIAAYNNRGAIYLNRCEFSRAKQDFESALLYFPEYDDAIKNLQTVNSLIFTDNIVLYADDFSNENRAVLVAFIFQTVDRLANIGELEKAEMYLRRGLLIDANNVQVYETLGVILFNQNKMEEAIDTYTLGLDLHPSNLELLLGRGFAKMESADMEGACSDWQIAANLGDADAQAFINMYCN